MKVDALELEDFRNYRRLEGAFSPGVNVIYGENAQGKTNLLESIAYLSTASSHRARYDRELIRLEAESASIKASVEARERIFRLEVMLRRGGRRQLVSNGVRLKTAEALSGVLKTVLFCPEDLSLIRAGAAERRRLLDECICQLRPRYAAALSQYKRLYEHKTRILRDWEEKPALLDTLDDFSHQMAQAGAVLIHYRAHFIRRLQEAAAAVHTDFSGGREHLELGYSTVKTVRSPIGSTQDIFEDVLEHQRSHRQAELEARQCLTGPHKDDLLVTLNGLEAKIYASQGQTRTAALSLKLGCREIFFHDTGEWPVLLLDDVLSELDRRRQEFVLHRITGGQVFITCCGDDGLEGLSQGAIFHVQNGQLM